MAVRETVMKKSIWITLVILLLAGAGWYWYAHRTSQSIIDWEGYVPNETFRPAFQALNHHSSDDSYDIEETVRVLNALEIAQAESDDFYEYLERMARQDYSKVPADVLQAKSRLLPILQKMNELSQQYKELDNIWSLVRDAATQGATTFAKDVNPIATIIGIFSGDVVGAAAVSGSLSKAKTAIFDKYAEDQKLRESLHRQIEELRLAYIDYLSEYAPVYLKYMKEWDALCLSKDKAYLDLYASRFPSAYNAASKVLSDYPSNREALLLKALSLVSLAAEADTVTIGDEQGPAIQASRDEDLLEADDVVDDYISLYPGRTAPALVLKGLINLQMGNESQAMSYFDQASVEYPRQAEALTDLIDSYRCRSYLNKSSEGKYLLQLYRSTMEGYGMFSPNLLKAKYHAMKGDTGKSRQEIFNHFYRRGNQGVYDCLLSDMQYCEENMYDIFRQLLLEQSFIDVSVEPTTNWYLSEKDDEVKVIINNRSDIDLENVRLFLCLHYTDMYKDEYDVVKVPSINIIPHHDKTEVGTVPLNYEDKTYNDITRVRAILMTDDKICWIDQADYKYISATQPSEVASAGKERRSSQLTTREEQFLKSFDITQESLRKALSTGMKVYNGVKEEGDVWKTVKGAIIGNDGHLEIQLPRIISLIDPVFSLHEISDADHSVRPYADYLAGSNIRLKFDYVPQQGEQLPLYVYSKYVSFRITISFSGTNPSITKIEVID